jgi:hypothetical protein
VASIEEPKSKKQVWADNLSSLFGTTTQSRLLNSLKQKSIENQSYIQPAPEPSFKDAFDRARFANTPLQTLDVFVATLRDTAIYKARKMLGAEMDKSLTALPADTMKMFVWALSGDWSRAGDRQFSEQVAKSIEHYFDKRSKPMEYGEYDISMAAGWMPKDPIRVNGIDNVKLDKPINNLFAVMIRNKDGSIEVLDPSVKAESLAGAAGKLTTLPFSLDNSYTDKKWKETAGSYIIGQLLPSILSGGTLGAAKGLSKVSKAETIQRIAENVKTLGKVEGGYGGIQLVNMGAMIGVGKYQTMITETASIDLARNIMDAMSDPKKLTSNKIRTLLNDGLASQSQNGSGARHVYIPSLREDASPWERLSQVLQGRIDGFSKPNHPWEEWKASKCTLPQMTEELKGNPKFMAGFYSLAEKAIAGKILTDQESLMLRVGSALVLKAKVDIAGSQFSGSSIKYTKEENAEAVDILRASMLIDLSENIDSMPDMAKRMGVDIGRRKKDSLYVLSSSEKLFDATDADLLLLIKRRSLEYTSQAKSLEKANPIIQNRIDSPFILG